MLTIALIASAAGILGPFVLLLGLAALAFACCDS